MPIKRAHDIIAPDERISTDALAARVGIPPKLMAHRIYDCRIPIGIDKKILGADIIAADPDHKLLFRPSGRPPIRPPNRRGSHRIPRPVAPPTVKNVKNDDEQATPTRIVRIADLALPDGRISVADILRVAKVPGLCDGTLRTRIAARVARHGLTPLDLTADHWRHADTDDDRPLLRAPDTTHSRSAPRGPRAVPVKDDSFKDDDLLNTLDVAAALGLSEETARRRIVRHGIPRVPRVAGRSVWKGADIRQAFFTPKSKKEEPRPASAPAAPPAATFFAVVDALDNIVGRFRVPKVFVGDLCAEWASRP